MKDWKTMNIRKFVSKLGRFNYTIHNLIGHPLMELLHILGQTDLGNKVHDITLPIEKEDP